MGNYLFYYKIHKNIKMSGSEVHDMSYYKKCMVGGILSCGITHALVCPLDIVKCRMQTMPGLYSGVGDGYSIQGFGKFGFYEMFKDVYRNAMGSDEKIKKYQTLGFAVSSACAEVIADCFLCPWEALKVKMQTAEPGTFTTSTIKGLNTINQAEGINGFYKGLQPLWARQIPYTIIKFVAFERIVQAFYTKVFTKEKSSYGKGTQLMVTFMSGYIAGVFCAIVSHPADTMVSILNKRGASEAGTGAQVRQIYGEIGFNGLWKGIGTRIFMVGTLTCMQWVIYDSFKIWCVLATTGGK